MITERAPSGMTDEQLEHELETLPWPDNGIITYGDEPTIERSNELMHERDCRKHARDQKAKGNWGDPFWWPQ